MACIQSYKHAMCSRACIASKPDQLWSVCQLFASACTMRCLWRAHNKVVEAPLLKLCSSSMCHGHCELKAFANVAHMLQACGSFTHSLMEGS